MGFKDLTIKKAVSLVKKGEVSVLELTQYYLNKIEELDKKIQTFLFINEKNALLRAKELDDEISDGFSEFELLGAPLAIKDNILIKGLKTTAGSKILENYEAVYDATVIKKLQAAGAIFLGKTNLDEFAMGSSTENSAFFITKNPWDETRVPGGSSGGSAAAVAAGMALGALGSDTGGSIRQPAGFCGAVGLKPTYGTVSRSGLIAMASSLDQIGLFAKNFEDAELIFKAISGYDNKDATSVKYNYIPKDYPIKGLKIGLAKEYFGKGLDSRIKELIFALAKKLEKLGAQIEEISLPSSDSALATYYIIMPAEVSANLARFDGVRYGLSRANESKSFWDIYYQSKGEGFGRETRRRVILGTYVLSHGYYEAYYLKAQQVRHLIKKDFDRAFSKVDLILAPTSPTLPFKIGEKITDPLAMYLSDIYTVPINLAGLPAASFNAGFIKEEGKNLPVGTQLIGNLFEEDKIFSLGKVIDSLEK